MTSVADQRLTLALAAAHLGTWTWDMAAGSTVWDTRLEELHGMPPGGFGGTFEDWLASMHPEDRAECLARVERALADPGPYVLNHRTIWPDGSVHYIECRGTVLVDADGTATGTTGVAMDVTERERRGAAVAEALVEQREVVDILQQALLPAGLPSVPGTAIAARYVAASGNAGVGGDWYAVVPLVGGRLGVAIGDVAGHGLGAVADMAAVRFSLRALALGEEHPERVLERLNEVVRVFESDAMITALYGVLDPSSRSWTYAVAGQCPVLIRDRERRTTFLDAPCDPPLGVAETFQRHEVVLEPGSTLLLYTDGLIERRTEPINIGLDRLELAYQDGPGAPGALCDYLLEQMLPRDSGYEDDVALVAVSLS